jgi:hypothetical protein
VAASYGRQNTRHAERWRARYEKELPPVDDHDEDESLEPEPDSYERAEAEDRARIAELTQEIDHLAPAALKDPHARQQQRGLETEKGELESHLSNLARARVEEQRQAEEAEAKALDEVHAMEMAALEKARKDEHEIAVKVDSAYATAAKATAALTEAHAVTVEREVAAGERPWGQGAALHVNGAMWWHFENAGVNGVLALDRRVNARPGPLAGSENGKAPN